MGGRGRLRVGDLTVAQPFWDVGAEAMGFRIQGLGFRG